MSVLTFYRLLFTISVLGAIEACRTKPPPPRLHYAKPCWAANSDAKGVQPILVNNKDGELCLNATLDMGILFRIDASTIYGFNLKNNQYKGVCEGTLDGIEANGPSVMFTYHNNDTKCIHNNDTLLISWVIDNGIAYIQTVKVNLSKPIKFTHGHKGDPMDRIIFDRELHLLPSAIGETINHVNAVLDLGQPDFLAFCEGEITVGGKDLNTTYIIVGVVGFCAIIIMGLLIYYNNIGFKFLSRRKTATSETNPNSDNNNII